MNLQEIMQDPLRGVCLFGTVPPPKKLSEDVVKQAVRDIAQTAIRIQCDGLIVYDIQDEPGRDPSGSERPFPFSPTHEPRQFAKELFISTKIPTIIYHAVKQHTDINEFHEWLTETYENYHGRNIVLVGGTSQDPGMSVGEAAQIILDRNNAFLGSWQIRDQFFMGGITIPERHRDKVNEHITIAKKSLNGIGFFTSQVVYNADNAIWLLRDYDEYCKEKEIKPVRIIFAFAPFGRESTVTFLRWLGVELPEGTVKRVLSRPTPKQRVDESLQICWENFRRILDASKRLKISVPIGLTVESVSKFKDEQEAASRLFVELKKEMDDYVSK